MRTGLLRLARTLPFLAALVVGGLATANCGDNPRCVDTNCSDYATHAEAQAAFDLDPVCREDLDADGDGIACEGLIEAADGGTSDAGGNQCPNTSSCGCSNYTKDQCGTDPCCAWVVGSGCGCA